MNQLAWNAERKHWMAHYFSFNQYRGRQRIKRTRFLQVWWRQMDYLALPHRIASLNNRGISSYGS
ncbi:MAG: hypothetical protein LUQ48_07675 [Methylococcaceae bacterium]|nr:hypothetical protein [Methylococcaceae bacterium]